MTLRLDRTAGAMLQAVFADPRDDAARFALADWLEEHGHAAHAQAVRSGVAKRFGVDFNSDGGALTLSPSDVGSHDDGWTVAGEVHEDYYEWVNDFEATHSQRGVVWGDFEHLVFATSEAAYWHFLRHHQPLAWDYADI